MTSEHLDKSFLNLFFYAIPRVINKDVLMVMISEHQFIDCHDQHVSTGNPWNSRE